MRKAPSPAQLGFTCRDRQRLAKALRAEADLRTFRRLQAVLLTAEGYDLATVAQMTNFSQRSLYRFVNRYLQTHQAADLHDRPRAGRPIAAPQITAARILHELQRRPLKLGYRTNVWTVELLAEHLGRQYGCTISPRTLRRRMRALGLRCKRPRYVYAEKARHLPQKKGRLSAA